MPTRSPMAALRSPELFRFGAMVLVFMTSGLGIAYFLLPPLLKEEPSKNAKAPPALRVGGVEVSKTGDLVANALDLVRRYAQGELRIKLPDGSVRKIRRSSLGAEIDRSRLASFVRESQKEDSALRRNHEQKKAGEPLDIPLPIKLDADTATAKLLDLKGELDAAATDAFVDLNERKLKPEKIGHRLDVYATLARIDAALRDGQDEVEAAVEKIMPKLSASSLGNVKFDQVLGYFETRYTQGSKSKDRTYNLRQAASKLDGAVVMPGEIFDFNEVVGPRDEAHGYRVAPVIAQGELVDGLGGGTCQISGTLHGAVFFAGLDVVERYPHSRPSYYIKLGLDATVVYPTINFRFRNNFDFPIVLHETVSNGVVRAEILGPERKLTVTYFRRIDEVIPFEEVERESPKLPEGMRVLAQRGIPGFRTMSSRVVRDGAYAVRTKWADTYPPTMQIVNVGTGPKDLETKASDDAHPEYVVDSYLVATQGPDIRTPGVSGPEPGGGTVESREPGRTGERGWTEKMGRYRPKDAGDGEEAAARAEGADAMSKPGAAAAAKESEKAKEGEKDAKASEKDARAEKPKKKKKRRKKPEGG